MCDVAVAGAGIWGCTVARRLAEAGKKVLVLEKREAVGGNCRCETVDGIEVHLYGSHIFHTSNEEVWQFVNRFVHFNNYRHTVLARTKKNCSSSEGGKGGDYIYHLPIGKTLFEEFFGISMKDRNLKEFLSSPTYGDAVFDAFIKGYTSKQWGVPPDKVDPSIIARLKVRDSYSTDYFDDKYQGIPVEGYNELFSRMLDHPNIEVRTGTEFRIASGEGESCHEGAFVWDGKTPVYYSGPIDALFGYKFGALPWRSLRFETERLNKPDYQGTTVVNYTDIDVPFTRIHEFQYYHPEVIDDRRTDTPVRSTIIMREYPADWQKGDEPYYPISNPESAALLKRYQEEAEKLNQSDCFILGGRLGQYKYFDMDKSIEAALGVKI